MNHFKPPASVEEGRRRQAALRATRDELRARGVGYGSPGQGRTLSAVEDELRKLSAWLRRAAEAQAVAWAGPRGDAALAAPAPAAPHGPDCDCQLCTGAVHCEGGRR